MPKAAHEIGAVARQLPLLTEADVALATLLGSCVAACIRDRSTGIGGLNHFLLPDGGDGPLSHGLQYVSRSINLECPVD